MVESQPLARQIDSWQAAEENAAAWMRYWGYRGVRLTSSGPDRGVDVRADGALAQVKFEARQIGRPQLQNLVGARGRDYAAELLFFTGTRYTSAAIAYADEMKVALFTYRLNSAVNPVNTVAARIMLRSGGPGHARIPPSTTAAAQNRVTVLTLLAQIGRSIVTAGLLLFGALCAWGLIVGAFMPENWQGDGPLGGALILLLAALCLTVGIRRSLRYFAKLRSNGEDKT